MLPPPVPLQTAATTLLDWVSLHPPTPHATRRVLRVPPLSPLHFLRHHPTSQKFYFRSRDRHREVAAASFVHRASGSVYTPVAHASLRRLLSPHDASQRFYGAARFHAAGKIAEEWAPYAGYTFVLPAVELVREGDLYFLAANYYAPGLHVLKAALRALVHAPPRPHSLPLAALLPRARHVEDLTSFAAWDAAMARILAHLSVGEYDKIVLARRKRFRFHRLGTPSPIHILSALDEQNAKTPSRARGDGSDHGGRWGEGKEKGGAGSYLFCLQLDERRAFLGCPPERLFRLDGRTILAEALAGTVRTGTVGNETDVLAELLGVKNMEEHRFVVDFVCDALAQCGVTAETDGPHVRRLPRLMHLATHIRAQFTCDEGEDKHGSERHAPGEVCDEEICDSDVFRLLATMHPTPAVCGKPQDRTICELVALEDFDRGFFAGPLGWFSREEGEFCVAIRSALVQGDTVTAYAGSGIVQASESRSEWDETELKMSAFTDLFVGAGYRKSIPRECHLVELAHCSQTPREILQAAPGARNTHATREVLSSIETVDAATPMSTGSAMSGSETSTATNSQALSRGHSSNSISSLVPTTSTSPSSTSDFFDTAQLHALPNLNTLWGCCCVEELCRNGVDTFFVAPGSRSAPLAVGVMRSRHAKYFVTHDERGAGFLAVGYARGTGRAAAVITSSGTAVANLMPAVVEAYMDSLPMILLTADRPPELRDVGANQAIHQPGMFGSYSRWTKDVPCPTEVIPLKNVLSDVDYAVYISGSLSLSGCPIGSQYGAGPVHLNFMFREKLAPDEQPWDRKYIATMGSRWKMSLMPLTSYISQTNCLLGVERTGDNSVRSTQSYFGQIISQLRSKDCGVIILGGGSGSVRFEDDKLALYEVAATLGWPIISDVCGGLRFDKPGNGLMLSYADQMLASSSIVELLSPDAILQFGERITSKRVSNMIQQRCNSPSREDEVLHVVVSNSDKRCDPSFTVTHRFVGTVGQVSVELKNCLSRQSLFGNSGNATSISSDERANIWEKRLSMLSHISQKIDSSLQKIIVSTGEGYLSEPACARILSEVIPKSSCLFLGNSMPIRDLDAFGRGSENGFELKIAANRGASGIDGIVSSGIGFGIGLNQNVTIVLGDMSMLHDLNSLHLLRHHESQVSVCVTVLVINNRGSGIFSILPIAKHVEVFSPVFDTPHSINFEKASDMFGLDYYSVRSGAELRGVLSVVPRQRHRLVEVFVSDNHAQNAHLHGVLADLISEQVSSFFDL